MALAPEDADEGHLELAAVAGIDDGIHAAVEVTQPEDHFEEGIWGAQVMVERPWKERNTNAVTVVGFSNLQVEQFCYESCFAQ